MKGIKKGRNETFDTQLGKGTTPVEALIIRIRQGETVLKKKGIEKELQGVREVTFPSISGRAPLNDPVVIKVLISNKEVNKAYMDCRSSYKVIYEHCFLKLKSSIRSKRFNSKIPLVGLWVNTHGLWVKYR